MLQGAVEALRADRAHQRRAGGPASLAALGEAPTEVDVTALRETLSEFGDRVAQLAERTDPPEAQRVL
jgi:hypothetical protein